MATRIKIMEMELDLMSEETFQSGMAEYLSNDYLNVVHLISLDYIELYDKNELVREALEEADLVLPGEKAILSAYHVDVLETGGMVVDYRSAVKVCDEGLLNGKKCYLILRNQKEVKIVYRYLATHFPQIEVVGISTSDSSMTEEALINDINSHLPDMIIMSMEGTEGEEWIHNNRLKINAKLCVVLSSVMDMIIRENIHVPKVLKMLHLGKIYTCLARIPYSGMWRRRIFQKKMDNYNNRKLMEIAEVTEELSDEDENKGQ